jgi:hypothetical protein
VVIASVEQLLAHQVVKLGWNIHRMGLPEFGGC